MAVTLLFGLVTFFYFLVLIPVYLWSTADSLWGGEDYVTSKKAVPVIAEILTRRGLDSSLLLDLGSCRGKFAVQLARKLPKLRIVGIENAHFRVLFSKLRAPFLGSRVNFVYGDLYATDVSKADVVHAYLPQEYFESLGKKLRAEMKPGALVLSYRVFFPDWEPVEVVQIPGEPPVEKVFVYQVASPI